MLGPASQELGLCARAGKAVSGQSESSVLGHGESSVFGSRQRQGRARQLCSGARLGRDHPVKACPDGFANFLRAVKSCVGCQYTPPG